MAKHGNIIVESKHLFFFLAAPEMYVLEANLASRQQGNIFE